MFHLKIDSELELQLFDPLHAEALSALIEKNRKYLRQWLAWLDLNKGLEDTQAFIEHSIKEHKEKKSIVTGVWYRGKLAGVASLVKIDWMHKWTVIGYWISEEMQGKGLVTKSSRALIDYAFHDLKLNRIEIRCATENQKSRAVIERLGLKKEGITRQVEWLYDHFVDALVYSVLAEEWSAERL
ncbi:MAG: hypothetical protein A3H42_00140 [Deltaproteobacteria bacterium RIFCSPLOWO2_02_FULL_46_8]|nr:MAG: hypothetical protein A3H42_00140 [Deltaproteobacteria bacterium RIFCSPLOWO2_02_FULL_46_8]